MDLVNAVFDQILQWPVIIKYVTGFSETLYRTRMGDGCDVAVSSLFKSARRESCSDSCPLPANVTALGPEDFEPYTCCLDFSHTYFSGGWALMSQQQSGTKLNYVDVFFQRDIVHAICVAVIGMFGVAHIIWLLERGTYGLRSSLPLYYQFRPKYLDGLKDGTWFAGTTVLGDVGSGMKLPTTPMGRLVSVVWVMFGLFLLSFVTSVISSTLTEAKLRSTEIRTVDDIAGKRVCMQTGFYEYVFESSFPAIGIQKTAYDVKADCYQALKDSRVDAVFGVREEFVNFFAQGQGAGLLVSPVVKGQEYAIAFPDSWEYGPEVNAAILTFREGGKATSPSYKDMVEHWYSGDANQVTYGGKANQNDQPWNWGLIITAIVLCGIYLLLQMFVMLVAFLTRGEMLNMAIDEDPRKPGSRSASMRSTKSFAARVANKISSVHPESDPMNNGPAEPGGTISRTQSWVGNQSGRLGAGVVVPDGSAPGNADMLNMLKSLVSEMTNLKAAVSATTVMPINASTEGARAFEPSPSKSKGGPSMMNWVNDGITHTGNNTPRGEVKTPAGLNGAHPAVPMTQF